MMLEDDEEASTAVIILAHTESPELMSAKSRALHKLANTTLIALALRKALDCSWGPVAVVANLKNAESIEKVAKEMMPGLVTIAECSESVSPIDAVREGLSCLEDANGNVFVIPIEMPLLETGDTLASMEAMLLSEGTSAQVPYVGLLNRSATRHPPVFCANIGWLRSLTRFFQLSRAEQNSKEGEDWVRPIRKAVGSHYCENPEKILVRLSTIGYAVCAARDEDLISVDTRANLSDAETILQSRLIKKHQKAGVTFRNPASTFLGLDVAIGMDTEIGVGLQIYGSTRIGQSCRIEGPTCISNSILDDGVYIRSFSVLEGAHVSEGSGAGPFARLREGTEIGPDSYIGNFVETKNASLGRNTLACHLTYIGDADVGSRTNIGAGTITCNFNGFSKNRTAIGNDAFVGSNSTLVAPVSIGDNTIVAAGSTITESVPNKGVSFGRARQVVKTDYAETLTNRLKESTGQSPP